MLQRGAWDDRYCNPNPRALPRCRRGLRPRGETSTRPRLGTRAAVHHRQDKERPPRLVPMAGRGQRFVDAGMTVPKPLVMAGHKHILDWSIDSIYPEEYNSITFIVRRDHVNSFGIDKILRQKYGQDVHIVVLDRVTQGTVCSCLEAAAFIDNQHPLVIFTLDVNFHPKFSYHQVPECDGFLLTFKANSQNYSYAEVVDGKVVRTAEKDVISPNAAVGIYMFKTGALFVAAAREMIEKELTTRGEYFVSPLYNLLIEKNLLVKCQEVFKMHLMGTPEELSFFVKKTLPKFGDKPIALCADHSGYVTKELAKKVLSNLGLEYIDFGTYHNADCDYTAYVGQATKHIQDSLCDFGLGFCRSGQGVNIAANKVPGIRSALVWDLYTAEYARRHNAANFFALPEKYVLTYDQLREIILTLQKSTFDGGRHQSRLQAAEKV